jgi:hypothetical protein
MFGDEFGVYGREEDNGTELDIRGVIEKLKASLAFMLAVEGR